MRVHVAIIGAGLAGLTAAYRLKQAGLSVVLIESDSKAGGKIRSLRLNDFTFDIGPNTVLESNEAIVRLLDDVGLRSDILWASPAAKARYILKQGKLHPLSPSPALLFSPLLSISAKWRLLKEPFVPPSAKPETVAEFFARRFGNEVLAYLIDPFLAGTFGARPEDIAVESAFPMLVKWEQQYGSVLKGALKARKAEAAAKKVSRKMFSFAGGFYEVVKRLTAHLSQELWLNTQIQSIEREPDGLRLMIGQSSALKAQRLLFATPAPDTARLLSTLEPALAAKLAQIPYSPIAQVFLGFRKDSIPPLTGFGFLVPSVEQRKILGAVFNHSIFPERYSNPAFTVFIGGSRQPELAQLPEADLMEIAQAELRELLGITALPIVSAAVSWQAAIPQYRLSHSEVLQAVADYEARYGDVFFAGNWRGGISVPDTVQQADTMAEKVARSLATAPSAHQLAH